VSAGFAAFLRKELRETVKTWRLWVLPGIVVVLGLTAPILTKATPALLRATERSQPGVVIRMPTPTAADAYLQFMGNLSQLVLLAIVITGAAVISGERKSGTAALVLTKPLSRAGFVVAKAVSQLVLLVAASLAGALVCVAATIALFGTTSGLRAFAAAFGLWLVVAAMTTTMMLFFSGAFDSQAAAAGAGLGVFITLSVLTAFPVTRDATPAGLLAVATPLLRHESVTLAVPLVLGAAIAVAFVPLAAWTFGRKEL
jgi:ABC-2 type transport system permease protein